MGNHDVAWAEFAILSWKVRVFRMRCSYLGKPDWLRTLKQTSPSNLLCFNIASVYSKKRHTSYATLSRGSSWNIPKVTCILIFRYAHEPLAIGECVYQSTNSDKWNIRPWYTTRERCILHHAISEEQARCPAKGIVQKFLTQLLVSPSRIRAAFDAISLTNKKCRSAIMLPLLCLGLVFFCNCALCSAQVWLHRVSHDFHFFSRLNHTIDSVFAVITSNPVNVRGSTRNNKINWRWGIFRFPIVDCCVKGKLCRSHFSFITHYGGQFRFST